MCSSPTSKSLAHLSTGSPVDQRRYEPDGGYADVTVSSERTATIAAGAESGQARSRNATRRRLQTGTAHSGVRRRLAGDWFEGSWEEYAAWAKETRGADALEPHRIKYKSLVRPGE
jgi:hypothetical protein